MPFRLTSPRLETGLPMTRISAASRGLMLNAVKVFEPAWKPRVLACLDLLKRGLTMLEMADTNTHVHDEKMLSRDYN